MSILNVLHFQRDFGYFFPAANTHWIRILCVSININHKWRHEKLQYFIINIFIMCVYIENVIADSARYTKNNFFFIHKKYIQSVRYYVQYITAGDEIYFNFKRSRHLWRRREILRHSFPCVCNSECRVRLMTRGDILVGIIRIENFGLKNSNSRRVWFLFPAHSQTRIAANVSEVVCRYSIRC